MRALLAVMVLGMVLAASSRAGAHALSLQECLEGGDFVAHAAQARDNGVTRAVFLDRLVADIRLIQSFPAPLRWFVADADDAEFLHAESARVFDAPDAPETHRAQFLKRCFDRSERLA